MKRTEILTRERSEEEKARRHREGDRGAKFSGGKVPKIDYGGVMGCITTMVTKDLLIIEMHDAAVCVETLNNKNMAKVYLVKNIKLIGKTIPDGLTSGGTGYSEYAHLLVEYENGESQKVTIGYYYQNTNQVFEQLYDKLYGCENPKRTHELIWEAMYELIVPAHFSDLPDKYQEPKREEHKPRKVYRIRKLTPRECFRLMGVSDADVDKIRDAGVSESQQYKMAGNSIVVQVLEGIFTQMFRKDSDVLF